MNCKLCCIFILVSLLLFLSPEISAQENHNITCLNQYYHNWIDGAFDIAVQGDYAYLACLDDGLRIVNVSNLDSPFSVGHLDSSHATSVAVSGNYAYVGGASPVGIAVVDVSDPTSPQAVASITATGYITELKIKGNRLYSAGPGGSMSVTDISDPLNPVTLWPALAYAVGFDVQGDIVYIAGEWDGLTVLDISSPEIPVSLGNFHDPSGYWLNDVAVADGYAYLANGGSGMIVVDLATMQEVATIDSLIFAFGVEIVGNLLYMNYGDPECPLAVIDITNPLSPQTLGIYYPPEDIRDFDVVGNLVYVADNYHGLRVVDASEPAVPEEIASYNRYGHNLEVITVGSLAYVHETTNLTILDVTDPQNPRELGYYETVYGSNDFEIEGNTAFFIGDVYEYLTAVDISDPTHPEFVGALSADYDNPFQLVIHDHYAYIVEDEGIRIIDVADPANMTEANFYSSAIGNAKITIDGQFLYIADDFNDNRILALDLADPTDPIPIGSWETGDFCRAFAVANGALFVSVADRVEIYDSSNPQTAPLAILDDFEQDYFNLFGIYIAGDRLCLSLGDYGIVVYNIQDLTNPQLVGRFNTPGYAVNSVVSGDILYLADRDNFGIYDISQAVLDVPQNPVASVSEFALLSNYPNPFNSSTQIRFEVGKASHVSIGVYDLLGRSVATLADQDFTSGTHVVPWNGTDSNGRTVASGRYFVMARAGDAVRSLPIVLLK
jgi:hypothetical protein